MRRRWIISGALAVALGTGLGLVSMAAWRDAAAWRAIASPDPGARAAAWARLDRGDPPRWSRDVGRLREVLSADGAVATSAAGRATDGTTDPATNRADILADAARMLAPHDLWSWSNLDDGVLAEFVALAGRGPSDVRRLGLTLVETAPQAIPLRPETPFGWSAAPAEDRASLFDLLLARCAVRPADAAAGSDDGARATALAAWVRALADDPAARDQAVRFERVRRLAASVVPSIRTSAEDAAWDDVPLDPRDRTALDDTDLLRRAAATPRDARPVVAVLETRLDADEADAVPIGAILRASDDPRATAFLEAWAARGHVEARRVLALDPTAERTAARRVRDDVAAPILHRLIATWRVGPNPASPLDAVLDAALDDPAIPPAIVALVAERHDDDDAVRRARAEAWATSLDERRVHAAVLLTVLDGRFDALEAMATRHTEPGPLRTLFRLATAPPDDPILTVADDALAADLALGRLARGEARWLQILTTLPEDADATDVAVRACLLERFVPAWARDVGRPHGGSARGLRLHLDRLDATRRVSWRAMRFDRDTRRFEPPDG